jgi:streptogramin lyase
MHRLRSLPLLLFALFCLGVVLVSAAAAAGPKITEFSIRGSYLGGIVAGPDGNLWFTETNGDRIGKITTAGHVTEYQAGISRGSAPEEIVAGPDGNLWFTEGGADSAIGKITTAGHVTEYRAGITHASGPIGIVAGRDGNLWFTEGFELGSGRIGKITPAGRVTEYSARITPGSSPNEIAAGPDGNLWFTANGINTHRIGRVVLHATRRG